MANMDYWYDEQIKRYLLQLVRVFSHFQVREYTQDGAVYNRVPCKYGDSSRMVAQILRNNSENVLNSAPQIAISIQNLALSRERAQDPMLVDTQQVVERKWDQDQGNYTSEQGNLYTIQRYMPVPYNLTIQVDIWTTNTDSKLQILEQLIVLFNPSIQLQSNDNPLDWSNVFELTLSDIAFSNRSIPTGTDDQIDIATLTFDVPIWISPPAKVTRQKIIQQIIADVYSVKDLGSLGYASSFYDFFGATKSDTTIIELSDYRVRLDESSAVLVDLAGEPQPWELIIKPRGELTAVSRMEFNLNSDISDRTDLVIGSVAADPINPSNLIFNLDRDTLPSNTTENVDRIIDPRTKMPRSGLPEPVTGQRYLLAESISTDFNTVWGVNANANDIIEYNGTAWVVVFNSEAVDTEVWVTNSFTNKQYRWTGTEWISSWQGTYNPGYWRLVL